MSADSHDQTLLSSRRAWLLSLLAVSAQAGDAEGAAESEIKAAMLVNFAKYVEWPGAKADQKSPLLLGVLGGDSLREALEGYSRGRAGRLTQVRRVETAGDAEPCHILYVAKSQRKRWMEMAPKPGVLTVGDSEAFTKAGGMIGFILKDETLRFEINLAAASLSGLVISSRLLRLALAVRQ